MSGGGVPGEEEGRGAHSPKDDVPPFLPDVGDSLLISTTSPWMANSLNAGGSAVKGGGLVEEQLGPVESLPKPCHDDDDRGEKMRKVREKWANGGTFLGGLLSMVSNVSYKDTAPNFGGSSLQHMCRCKVPANVRNVHKSSVNASEASEMGEKESEEEEEEEEDGLTVSFRRRLGSFSEEYEEEEEEEEELVEEEEKEEEGLEGRIAGEENSEREGISTVEFLRPNSKDDNASSSSWHAMPVSLRKKLLRERSVLWGAVEAWVDQQQRQ